jgi:hypothetical protein
MTATASGTGHQATCQDWIKGGNSSATATGDVVCDYANGGLDVLVRDTGGHFLGNPLCDALKVWKAKGGPVPMLDGSVTADANSCIVKINNHDMMATATGPGHDSACLAWRRAGGLAATASGDMVCDVTSAAGLDIAVRDTGSHGLGNNLCGALAHWKSAGGDPPDFTATCSSFTSIMTQHSPFHDINIPEDALLDYPKHPENYVTNEVSVLDLSDYLKCAMTTQGWIFVASASGPTGLGTYGFTNWYCLPNGTHPPPAAYDIVLANPGNAPDKTTAKRATFALTDDFAPEDHCP